jgi:translocator protein
MNFWNKYKSLALVIVLTYLISLPAGLATSQSVGTWYVNIIKPSFNPPNWVFAPVWTMLYSLMSVAVWNVWNGLKEIWKLN